MRRALESKGQARSFRTTTLPSQRNLPPPRTLTARAGRTKLSRAITMAKCGPPPFSGPLAALFWPDRSLAHWSAPPVNLPLTTVTKQLKVGGVQFTSTRRTYWHYYCRVVLCAIFAQYFCPSHAWSSWFSVGSAPREYADTTSRCEAFSTHQPTLKCLPFQRSKMPLLHTKHLFFLFATDLLQQKKKKSLLPTRLDGREL